MKCEKVLANYFIIDNVQMTITTDNLFFRTTHGLFATLEQFIETMHIHDARNSFDNMLINILEKDGELFEGHPVNEVLHDTIS